MYLKGQQINFSDVNKKGNLIFAFWDICYKLIILLKCSETSQFLYFSYILKWWIKIWESKKLRKHGKILKSFETKSWVIPKTLSQELRSQV